jgi:uncharacterized phiE125 gp8 family phage protein
MLTIPWTSEGAERDRITAWRTRGASTLVTPPTLEPVDVDFAKLHGKIDVDTDDPLVEFRYQAAREFLERYTGRACMAQTHEWTILDGDIVHTGPIFLPVCPVISVTSVTSYDAAGAGTVMSSAGYFLDKTSAPARLLLNDGYAWPSGLRRFNSLVVRYLAGYGTDGTNPDLVPFALRQAILLLASEWHERIEGTSDLSLEEMPFGIRALVDPYRVCA